MRSTCYNVDVWIFEGKKNRLTVKIWISGLVVVVDKGSFIRKVNFVK